MSPKLSPEELKELGTRTRTEDRRSRLRYFILATLIVSALVVSWKHLMGDTKLWLKRTGRTYAVIDSTEYFKYMKHTTFARGGSRLRLFYSFEIDSKIYMGVGDVGPMEGVRHAGDQLEIEYAIEDPSVHEVRY